MSYSRYQYWEQLNSTTIFVAFANTSAPTPKIRYNFNDQHDTDGTAVGSTLAGLRLLKIASDAPTNMVSVVNNGSASVSGWYSTNSGSTWSAHSSSNFSHGLLSGISANGQVMAFARTHATESFIYSTNAGSTWSSKTVTLDQPRGMSMNSDGSKSFFVGGLGAAGKYSGNTLGTFTNRTLPWIAADSFMLKDGSKIWITRSTNAGSIAVAYSTNNGANWTTSTVSSSDSTDATSATLVGSDNGQHMAFVCGTTYNYIFVTNNGGTSWNKRSFSESLYQFSISMSKSGRYITLGSNANNGKYFYSTDYGQTFNSKTISGVSAILGATGVQEI